MLLIVIVLGMVTLQLGDDDSTKLNYEANRLAMLLQTAQEEAILQGQTITLTIKPKGYNFTGEHSKPFENDEQRSHPLPDGMKFSSVTIDGVSDFKEPPNLTVPATGEVPPFIFILKLGKNRWRLEGLFGGEIKASAPTSDEEDHDV